MSPIRIAAAIFLELLFRSARRLISFDTTAYAPESGRYLLAHEVKSSSDAFLASSGVIRADIEFLEAWWSVRHGSMPFMPGDDANELTDYGRLMQIEFPEFMRKLTAAAVQTETPNVRANAAPRP
jgi:hypothetical protein